MYLIYDLVYVKPNSPALFKTSVLTVYDEKVVGKSRCSALGLAVADRRPGEKTAGFKTKLSLREELIELDSKAGPAENVWLRTLESWGSL